MQQVNQQWLRWLLYALIGVDILIVTVFFATRFAFVSLSIELGVTTPVAILAGLHLFYATFLYQIVESKNSWFANTISAILFGALLAASILDGHALPHFRILLVLYSLLYAMNGLFIPLIGVTIAWLLLALGLSLPNSPMYPNASTDFITNITATAAVFVGWFLFRPRYTSISLQPQSHLNSLLAQEKFKSSVILESISDGVIVTDTHGTIQVINTNAALMLGWEQKDALHLNYRSIVQPFQERASGAQAEETAIDICARSQQSAQKISLLVGKNQRRTYVDIAASPILETTKDDSGSIASNSIGVIAVLRNVDKQKREEEQRSEFISTASHEMRTPVASIQGFLELALNEKVATIDDKARGYLLKAHQASKHLGKLFQDLLTASKSEDGRLINNPTIIEAGEILSQIVDHAKIAAEKKGLKIVLETTQSTDKAIAPLLYIHADPERFREVVTNLIDNAIKYTEHGMVTVGASLREKTVVIRVSDTGMGVSPEDIPHLFQKFYRTDNSATREIGGTGLGLYISKQIVEVMGGQIWVESTLGAGSTFFIELPRVSPEAVIKQSGGMGT